MAKRSYFTGCSRRRRHRLSRVQWATISGDNRRASVRGFHNGFLACNADETDGTRHVQSDPAVEHNHLFSPHRRGRRVVYWRKKRVGERMISFWSAPADGIPGAGANIWRLAWRRRCPAAGGAAGGVHCPELAAGLPTPRLPAENPRRHRRRCACRTNEDRERHRTTGRGWRSRRPGKRAVRRRYSPTAAPTCGASLSMTVPFADGVKQAQGSRPSCCAYGITVFSDEANPAVAHTDGTEERDDDSECKRVWPLTRRKATTAIGLVDRLWPQGD